MKHLIVISVIALTSLSASASYSDFTTDGCSMFPDGKIFGTRTEWRHCCVVHDIDYWIGGEKVLKEKTDKELKACVEHIKGKTLGTLMWLGVTTGGLPSPASWSWAYGRKNRNYRKLETSDLKEIASKFDAMINTLILEKNNLDIDQLNLLVFKVKNKILQFKAHIDGGEVELERLLLKVDELVL